MPITRSSRVLYRWLLPVVVFGAVVFKLLVWWLECNRLLRLGRPVGAVTLSR